MSISIVTAQPVNNLINDVVMPAPNAAALGKYADIPVSYNTGVPNISIPLYQVQEGSLSLPISISYHASGVKVGETASWVGLGWSLSAGGMISRTVLGLPDELSGGYFINGSSLADNPDEDTLIGLTSELVDVLDGVLDSEPDIFTFNVGGYAGKFQVNHALGKVYTIPQQDVKITYSYSTSNIESFTITTPDGTKYHFGNNSEKEFSHPYPNSSPTAILEYTSSWYLTKIESADSKHEINFHYVTETYKYSNLSSCQYTATLCGTDGINAPAASCGGNVHPINSNIFVNYQRMVGRRLDKITTSTDSIFFYASSSDREDLDTTANLAYGVDFAKSLERIEIKSGTFCKNGCLDMIILKTPLIQVILKASACN
ncbi:MAG: hypothetical protein IPJ74_08585 [Saprospiraceae bacterium]|nr:hypothetical protein [Saprospiraceae bacterium]